MSGTAENIADVFLQHADIESLGYQWTPDADVCSLCAVDDNPAGLERCYDVIERPCARRARTLKGVVASYLDERAIVWEHEPPSQADIRRHEQVWEATGLPLGFPPADTDFEVFAEGFGWYPLESTLVDFRAIDVTKHRDYSKFIEDYGLAPTIDGHRIGPGMWQSSDGRLAQMDATVPVAGALIGPAIQGIGDYSFDVSFIGGLDDGSIGFGAIIPDFVLGVEWDPQDLGGSGLRARVYNSSGAIHAYGGFSYDVELPAALIADITQENMKDGTLRVQFRVDSTNGNVWVRDPIDPENWHSFTLGQSLEDGGHNMIGVGTASGAASFGNFFATPLLGK